MFLDIQNQLRDSVQTEPGYAEAYAAWSTENKNALYLWSAEQRTERFSTYMKNKVEKDLLKLVGASNTNEEEKKKLKTLTKRGQLLLVSTDGGKAFDRFLTPEEAKNVVATDYQILSPTLRSATTDLKEVIAEQTLLHVVSTVAENLQLENEANRAIWTIKNAYVEKGVVHVEVARSAEGDSDDLNGVYQVLVAVDQDPASPVFYERIDPKGVKQSVPETQLFNEYGEAKPDVTLQPMTQEELITHQMMAAQVGSGDAENAAMGAGLAMLAAQEAASHATADQRATEAAMFAKTSMNQPLMGQAGGVLVPNVTAAKAAMAARFARQAQALQAAQKREMERIEKSKKMQKLVNKQTKNAQKARKSAFSASQKRMAKGVGATAGIAGAVAGAISGSTIFVTLLS